MVNALGQIVVFYTL